MSVHQEFATMTKDEWVDLVKEEIGLGVSYDDAHPLSTYQPISKDQLNTIAVYYVVYHNELNSYDEFQEVLKKIQKKFEEEPAHYRFKELYPTFVHFTQMIAEKAQLFTPDSETYPTKKYWPITPNQIELAKKEYVQESQRNRVYTQVDFDRFIQDIEKQSDKTGQAFAQ